MFDFDKYCLNPDPFAEKPMSAKMSDYFYKDYIKPFTKEDLDKFSKMLDDFYDKWMKKTFEKQ